MNSYTMYGIPLPDDKTLDPIGTLKLWGVISPEQARQIKRSTKYLQDVISPVLRERGYNSTTYLNAEKCSVGIYEKSDIPLRFLIEIIPEKDWSDEDKVHVLWLSEHSPRRDIYTSMKKRKTYYRKLIQDAEESSNQNKVSSNQEN